MSHDSLEALLAAKAIAAFRNPPRDLFPLGSRFMADFAGVALEGARAASVTRLYDAVDRGGGGNGRHARAVLTGERMPLRSAAIINGMAGHFHDFDDDDPAITIAHPSVASLAAIFAVADEIEATGADVVSAYITGAETMSRVARVCNPSHYNAGWHATASLGIFGATVASGLLMGLDEHELAQAIGIAASLASGVKANFGSDMKPLQVGQAAGNGLWAAQLAQSGIKATDGALFGKTGYLASTGATLKEARPIIEAFGQPYCFVDPGLNIKLYPCCSSAHTSMDALIELMELESIAAMDIERLDVWIGRDQPTMLVFDLPLSGLQGKFSMRYCATIAALTLRPTIDDFTDEAIKRPDVEDLIRRTAVHIDESFEPCDAHGVTHQSRVRITTRSGQAFERSVRDPLGSKARPVSDDRLRQKFLSCTVESLGKERAEAAYDAMLNAANLPTSRALIDALVRS